MPIPAPVDAARPTCVPSTEIKGAPGLVLKLVATVRRKSGMTVAAFQVHWRTRHAQVVAKLPGLRRYVQSHTLPSGYRKGELVWDGIAELWFDDTDALRALRGSAAQNAVDADEERFLDRGAMKVLF